jgi:hypothetical protein
MYVLNRSLLNKEYNLINVPQALVATVSKYRLRVIFLLKITSDILHCLQQEYFSIKCKEGLR